MMTLYHYEGCPYCRMVRQRLSDLELTYLSVCVPVAQSKRQKVVDASGQPLVPVLVDGDVVLSDENEIVRYLDTHYGHGETHAPSQARRRK